ncbi:hypothetical protein L1987_13726 [Smallanthus sonchifolius]|uniref:Uncharacterized protein n=1 Tax=Smallanthus sonchifolius TaxID=185202 RepID=A0ACB9JI64_9ASTR|nr:hypothetical protein L1987_13726 [Smallanthus sonchifolius]
MASSSSSRPRKRRATSSRQPAAAPRDPPSPPGSPPHPDVDVLHPIDHRWLQFDPESQAYEKLMKLRRKSFEFSKTICWSTLTRLGVADRVRAILGPVWLRFFDIQGYQYREICLEFFSTYSFKLSDRDFEYGEAIQFRLGGVDLSCSLKDFARRMGLYNEEEMETDMFLEDVHDLPDTTATPTLFWREIGEGNYNSNVSKAYLIRDPVHHYIQRVLAHTISGRKKTPGVVSVRDLFFLRCLLRPVTCNVAYCLGDYFTSCTGLDLAATTTTGSPTATTTPRGRGGPQRQPYPPRRQCATLAHMEELLQEHIEEQIAERSRIFKRLDYYDEVFEWLVTLH